MQYCVYCPEGNKKYQSKIGHICQTRSKAQFTIYVPESPSMCPMFNTCPWSIFYGDIVYMILSILCILYLLVFITMGTRNKYWYLLYLIKTTFFIELSLKVFMSFMTNYLSKYIRKKVYLFSLIRLCKQIFLKNVSDNGFVVIHTLCSTYIGYMSAHLIPVFLETSNPCKYFSTR